LLIVIAVIAVVVALALPGVRRIREQANRATCASKLRQLGSATLAYAVDWNGFGPPNGSVNSLKESTAIHNPSKWKWAQYPQPMDKYLGFDTPKSGGLVQINSAKTPRQVEMYYGDACPSNRPVVVIGSIVNSQAGEGNYSWAFGANSYVLDPAFSSYKPDDPSRWYRLSTLRGNDLRVALFFDSFTRSIGTSQSSEGAIPTVEGRAVTNNGQPRPPRHFGEGLNFCFVDGHVEFIRYRGNDVWADKVYFRPQAGSGH
jgi:prepilin-type processing-associated H-X9-DG protein